MAGLEKLARDKKKRMDLHDLRILFLRAVHRLDVFFFTRGDFDALLFPLGDSFLTSLFYARGEERKGIHFLKRRWIHSLVHFNTVSPLTTGEGG